MNSQAKPAPDFLHIQLQQMAPHRAILRSIESRFMAAVPLVHPVLDIGSGDGHFAQVTYNEAIDVGIDVMDRDMEEAKHLRPDIFLELVKASATQMPFEDNSFATVLSNCVIEHIPDVDSVMSEIARVLRPGGTFATTLPSEHYPEFLLGSTIFRKLGIKRAEAAYGNFFNKVSHHYHVDPPEVWKARLESVGLEVQEQCYYFSADAHHAFDMAHYLGLPNLASKRLLGKWVLHPIQTKPFERWYRKYYDEPLPAAGAYQFVRCIKRG